MRLALQGPSVWLVVAAERIELSLAGKTDARWGPETGLVTISPLLCLRLALQAALQVPSVRLVVAAEPIKLSLAGQTDVRSGRLTYNREYVLGVKCGVD